MAKAKIIFTLDGVNSIIQCSTENKMKEICQNYATKINKKIDTLLFLYEGNQINFEQTFINQAISIDKNNNEMKISVYKKDKLLNNLLDLDIQTNIINNKENQISIEKEKYNINKKNNNNLMDNIKSKYIIEMVFSYIEENLKLKMVKYNKYLQNKMDIKLDTYKFFCTKYIEYEENGIVKEYNKYNDKLIYEGEYLNGKRNGKGKEYDRYEYLIFVGEFLKGKRWNGKGYDGYNHVLYEIKDGKGHIKEYECNKLKIEGEYLNGQINGNGKEYNSDRIVTFLKVNI